MNNRNGRQIGKSANPPKTVLEWKLQAAGVTQLRRMMDLGARFLIAGDMAAQKRGLAAIGIAKATGLEPGDPDLRIYLPAGRVGLIEYKGADGRLSKAQKDRHADLAALGHDVAVIKSDAEDDAARQTVATVNGWLRAAGVPFADNDNLISAREAVARRRGVATRQNAT